MKALTVDDIMALRPCRDYPRERVAKLWGKRKALTPLKITYLKIPGEDIVWVLCHQAVLPHVVQQAAVTAIVDRAVRNEALPYPATTEWAKKWLSGEDRSAESALAAADFAAGQARAAALAARWLAEGVGMAADAAVMAAADCAVDAAAMAAADWAAELKLQVEDFRRAILAAEGK